MKTAILIIAAFFIIDTLLILAFYAQSKRHAKARRREEEVNIQNYCDEWAEIYYSPTDGFHYLDGAEVRL